MQVNHFILFVLGFTALSIAAPLAAPVAEAEAGAGKLSKCC